MMKKILLAISLLMWTGVAFSQVGTACIFSPAELGTTLGKTPEAGVASKDRLGILHCQYKIKNKSEKGFSVLISSRCDQSKFESKVKLNQSMSGKSVTLLKGYGDGAYFSPTGLAAVRVGTQCIELSGIRSAGTNRPIVEADAAPLLKLTVSRFKK
jgi:hypothetical protein